jgi:GT2 family glycosyltransferase
VNIVHLDLSANDTEPVDVSTDTYYVFWWKSLPLGARRFSKEELPLSRATRIQLATDFGAAQIAGRDAHLGAMASAGGDAAVICHALPNVRTRPGEAMALLDALAHPPQPGATDVSLIVCTRDRLDDLAACLDGLTRLSPAPVEIIVVDNSGDGNARGLVSRFPVCRYVAEPRPGLSRARNAGIAAASCDIIAFTDDDAVPASSWIGEILLAFDDPSIDAVTGLILPLDLSTEAQRFFQFRMGGLGGEFVPVLFDDRFFAAGRSKGAPVWRIGAGANMAFRREAFERLGTFDERLGAGASGCSEDSELWYRILATSGRCLYEPRAVVYHRHRRDMPGLRRQARAYMRGHVSALVVQYDRYGDRGNLSRIMGQLPKHLIGVSGRALLEWETQRLVLALHEAIGWLAGTLYLLRWGWRRKRPVPKLGERTI